MHNASRAATSKVVTNCQICNSTDLGSIIYLGDLPPVNLMTRIGERPTEQTVYPAELLICRKCSLAQLGLIVDRTILFPKEYPYTSSTTKILRENFAELYQECRTFVDLSSNDLVVDIGSNDGNLLSNFQKNHRVLGVTPEKIGEIAVQRGIETLFTYFDSAAVPEILKRGKPKIVTATNVFAHIDQIHDIVKSILEVLAPKGVFISESHYLLPLVETLQYDTVYHEHMRYYSLKSLTYLLNQHGLEVFHAKPIPTHGGSIRVYAARKGDYPVNPSVSRIAGEEERVGLDERRLLQFRDRVIGSKLGLMALLRDLKKSKARIHGISAPSRASTLINYCGLDDGTLDCVLEVPGSHKIGNYAPGTRIPIVDEKKLFEEQPEYALLLSWHIADELMPKLWAKGYKGKFIVPLPEPRVVSQ